MVVLKESNFKRVLILCVIIGLLGVVLFASEFTASGEFVFVNVIAEIALIIAGISGFISTLGISKRYNSYFQEKKVITISELSKELNLKERKIRTELSTYIDRSDKRNIKKCESVQFGE